MSLVLQSSGGGQITIQEPATASNFTQTLPAATGEVVVTGANSAIVSGSAVASTSGTSIDFTSIPSWVKRVTVMFSGVSTNGTSNILVQIGDSGGVENTGYTSVASYTTGSAGSISSTAGYITTHFNEATSIFNGNCYLTLLNASTNTWCLNGNLSWTVTFTGMLNFAGSKSLSATLDRVRITTVNGTDTFDAGSINILYE